MNFELLLEQLIGVFPTRNKAFPDSLDVLTKIEAIITDRSLNMEERTNALEAYLITAFNSEKDDFKKKTYELAIKIVLMNRGYYTDGLGTIENALLMLAYQHTSANTSNKKRKKATVEIDPILEQNRWSFINRIRFKISHCMNQNIPMEAKIQIVTTLLKHYYKKNKIGRNFVLMTAISKPKKDTIVIGRKNGSLIYSVMNASGVTSQGSIDAKEVPGMAQYFDGISPGADLNLAEMQRFLPVIFGIINRNTGIEYLVLCMSKVKEFHVITSTIEHSIWASAGLEVLYYLNYLGTADFLKNAGTQRMQKEKLDEFMRIHLCRAQYFIDRSSALEEPIAPWVKSQVVRLVAQLQASDADPKLVKGQKDDSHHKDTFHQEVYDIFKQATLAHRERISSNIESLTTAHTILINYRTNHENLSTVLNLADTLKDNNHTLAPFIKICALILMGNLTKKRWDRYFDKLKDVVIPKNWRTKVYDLWLCLAEYFVQNKTENTAFFDACARACVNQITERYGKQKCMQAKIKLAEMMHCDIQAASLKGELEKLTVIDPDETPETSDFIYKKQTQYHYVMYLTQSADVTMSAVLEDDSDSRGSEESASSDSSSETAPEALRAITSDAHAARVKIYTDLLTDDYAYGLEIVVNLLAEPSSPECRYAAAAVEKKYGHIKYANPLTLCDRIFRKQTFNGYWLLWGPLYCAALNNGFLAKQIKSWGDAGIDRTHIRFKLLNYVRSWLEKSIYSDTPSLLVPGGCNYLLALDKNLVETTDLLVSANEQDPKSTLFAWARGIPGMYNAIYADLGRIEKNNYLEEQEASKAIEASTLDTSRNTKSGQTAAAKNGSSHEMASVNGDYSPRKAVTATSPRVETPEQHGTPELPSKKKGSRGVASNRQSVNVSGSGSATPKNRQTSINLSASGAIAQVGSPTKNILGAPPRSEQTVAVSPPASSPALVIGGKRSGGKSPPVKRLDLGQIDQANQQANSSVLTSANAPHTKSAVKEITHEQPSQNKKIEPCYWAYFLHAEAIWFDRLKGNRNPLRKDLDDFKTSLNMARKCTDFAMSSFIKAKIWWHYADSVQNPIWFDEQDNKKYDDNYKKLEEEDKHFRSLPEEHEKVAYLLFMVYRDYAERAMKDVFNMREKFHFFPPAVMFYAIDVYCWLVDFCGHDKERYEGYVLDLIEWLEKAILLGHHPAIHYYAQILLKHLDLLRCKGLLPSNTDWNGASPSHAEKKLQELLTISQLYVHIESGQVEEIEQHLQDIRKMERLAKEFGEMMNREYQPQQIEVKEAVAPKGKEDFNLRREVFKRINTNSDLATLCFVSRNFGKEGVDILRERRRLLIERRSTFPIEILKPINHTFTKVPLKLQYFDTLLTILYKAPSDDSKEWGFQLIWEADSRPEDVELLQRCFQLTEEYYCNANQVCFAAEMPVLQHSNNQLLVTHADIAILGLIKVVQSKKVVTGKRDKRLLQESVIALIEFFREIRDTVLVPSPWQCERTPIRLKKFIEKIDNYNLDLVRKEVEKVQTLSPHATHLSIAPSNCGSVVGSPKGSRIFASPPPIRDLVSGHRTDSSKGMSPRKDPLIATSPRRDSNADGTSPFRLLSKAALPVSPRSEYLSESSSRLSKRGSTNRLTGIGPAADLPLSRDESDEDATVIRRGRSQTYSPGGSLPTKK